jgi:hypothetical protein
VCPENWGEGFYIYLYTRTPRISEKKGNNLLFDRIRHLVCLGNERRDSPPWYIYSNSKKNKCDSDSLQNQTRTIMLKYWTCRLDNSKHHQCSLMSSIYKYVMHVLFARNVFLFCLDHSKLLVSYGDIIPYSLHMTCWKFD